MSTSNNKIKIQERGEERRGDRPVAVVALKRFGAGVFAVVPRQLVAPGESPLAALPRALVRLLTWGMQRRKHLFHTSLKPRVHKELWDLRGGTLCVVISLLSF